VPERLHPYTYDVLGASHQVLHVMVIFAGLAHMVGLLKAFDHVRRQENTLS
jgi:adiponectin receptor